MNILVSGGFGYIGCHLLTGLLQRGFIVGVVARRIPEYAKEIAQKCDIYVADVSEPVKAPLRKKYDLFIHLAAANDTRSKDSQYALHHTTLSTKHCLDMCLENGIDKFIYFSTFQVYGDYHGWINEKTPTACQNEYALSHFFAEEYVKMYHRRQGIQFIIVRPTNVFGAPWQATVDRWSLVPNCFCQEAFTHQAIRLRSSGKQKRDFIGLEDLTGLTSILCKRFSKNKNEIINLSSGRVLSILRVAEMVTDIYEEMFSRKCRLEISSTHPLQAEDFRIQRKKVKSLNHTFSSPNALADEIRKIFHLLKRGQHGSDHTI